MFKTSPYNSHLNKNPEPGKQKFTYYFNSLPRCWILSLFLLLPVCINLQAQDTTKIEAIDKRVSQFLNSHRDSWHDANVPESDGKILYDIIVKNGNTRALEIGTSTGHSAIWIAWALSKTGGRLLTIEIDERRYTNALSNFEAAGLSEYIDARHADAHKLVFELEGSFDFVFCDADKSWYVNYFKHIWPKVTKGGCFAAHNVLNSYFTGIPEFLRMVQNLSDGETEIIRSSSSGISVTCRGLKNKTSD